MCWMSSKSSIWMALSRRLELISLHLVEHRREGRLEGEGLLDLVRADEWVFAVFQEARALMLAHELRKGGRVRLPVLRETLEVLEHGAQPRAAEDGDGIFR